MACPQCAPSPEVCVTVYPTLNPCECDSPGGIEETGPAPIGDGPKGETPEYSVGTASSGDALIVVASTGYATRTVSWIIPAVPMGVPYTWSKVNTFQQPSVFHEGLETTGGTTTFGGNSLTVTPNATFSGDVTAQQNETISGNLTASSDVEIEGNVSVDDDAVFQDVTFSGPLNLEHATMSLSDAAGYVSARLVIDSCLKPEAERNHGSAIFTKGEATGLVNVNPNSDNAVCDTIVINIPVSACLPQVTPVCDVLIRVAYQFGSSGTDALGNFNATLWQGGLGTTQIDFYTQGDGTLNSQGGCLELRGRATLVAGNNNFDIEVANNDSVEGWVPTDITYYFTNP